MPTRSVTVALLFSFLGLVPTLSVPAQVCGADVEITVDPAAAGPAISPYVYGQFIEHLGRCIRDGIWAEKLRDRKFLLELGKSWQVLKPAGAAAEVFLDTAGAYGGEHCLAVWVRDATAGPCGVRQDGIGLVAEKEYVGYAVLAHAAGPAPVELRVAWGPGEAEGYGVAFTEVGPTYQRFPFRFRAGATTDAASLSLTLAGPGHLWAACLSLMPADNIHGMRADTLALIKRLAPPIVRWPGGNFVSGYLWKDGIGDRDRRPPRWERAWNDVEDNDFGIDEFLVFCREVQTEPLVVVNTGLGSVELAAEEVAYANSPADTTWGARRAAHGHPQPYGVMWWGIGNEMYGGWQLGNVPVERYALRHNAFVRAMRAVDPQIKTIAVGAPGKWNDAFLPVSASHLDLLSAHHYSERKLRVPFSPEDAKTYTDNFLNYSDTVAAGVRGLIADFRKRVAADPQLGRIQLSIDEWGLVRDWNPTPDGPGVGSFEHYYPLGDAIAIGRALHELLRSADVVGMANWPQTVNVIGAIKTTRNHAALDPVGHVLALYRAQLGGTLVPVTVAGDAPLDVVAARDPQRGTLVLGLINFSPSREVTVALRVPAGSQASAAWRISGAELGAINVPGQPEAVTTGPVAPPPALEAVPLPAHSITVLVVKP